MCGIAGLISHRKVRENGKRIKRGITLQNDRGNGLGAGYAAYGIYPRYKDFYAFHVMAGDGDKMSQVNSLLEESFIIHRREEMPVWNDKIQDHPVFRRYFVEPGRGVVYTEENIENEDDYTTEKIMHINSTVKGGFIFSSGKNMGVFKGVGTPEDIYDFFCLDDYEGHTWLAHNRFPTNTPGWWGGAHPFSLLDMSIVHNGEISSYGINNRYLEGYGYVCNMQTDSEVVAYLLDLMIRKHGLSVADATIALAPPHWSVVERIEDEEVRGRLIAIKTIYESAMLNGPFAILAAYRGGLFSVTDNTKLRPLTVGDAGDYSYFASEVSALYEMETELESIRTPRAGQPCVIGYIEDESDVVKGGGVEAAGGSSEDKVIEKSVVTGYGEGV